MAKSVLVTGFEPFGGEAVNASWEAVRRLPEQLDGWTVHRACLPVVFGGAAETVLRLAGELRPDAVVCTGVAGGRSAITPEVIAVNLCDARIPDNAGAQPRWQPIAPGGPDGLFSGLPVREMAAALRAVGLPAALSWSAGSYVCNDVFYRTVRRCREWGIPCGFIHVPPVTALPAEEGARGLAVCLSCLWAEC